MCKWVYEINRIIFCKMERGKFCKISKHNNKYRLNPSGTPFIGYILADSHIKKSFSVGIQKNKKIIDKFPFISPQRE